MVCIARGKIDVSVVIGVVVVVAIIGSAIFGVYYFLIYAPAKQRLEDAKIDALSYLDEKLGSIVTYPASDLDGYRMRIQDAGSTGEVAEIKSDVTRAYNIESERFELLAEVELATDGTFHSLPDLALSLKENIDKMTSLDELQSYTIGNQATEAWRNLLSNVISGIESEDLVMKRNSSFRAMTKADAMSYVEGSSWQTLRELDFVGASYVEVPILDTVDRAPTIKAGSRVNVYVYDMNAENLQLVAENVEVTKVLYSKDDGTARGGIKRCDKCNQSIVLEG